MLVMKNMKKRFYILPFLLGGNLYATNNILPTEHPNIILIVCDDLGYADMSFLPQSARDVHTPNIDRLARQGVYFQQAYATCPVSSPARAGIITGRYQQRWGNYWFMQGGLPQSEKTIPEYLKEKGYYTIKVGKTHKNGKQLDHPLLHGFDEFFGFLDHSHSYTHLSFKDIEILGEKNARLHHVGPLLHNYSSVEFTEPEAYTTDLFTEKAVSCIKSCEKRKQPYFLYLSYNAVHIPTYDHTETINKKYGLSKHEEWNPEKESYNEWHNRINWKNYPDPYRRKRYLACLEKMDEGIGKILDQVTNDNTIIVFLSDNGGTHNTDSYNTPLSGHKYQLNEGGIRIPLIISCPIRWQPHINTSSMISSMDLLPTFLEILHITPDREKVLDGKSLLNVLKNKGGIQHETLVFDTEWAQAVRKGDWKWIKVKDGKKFGNFTVPAGEYLYNLSYDIREENNQKEKHPQIVRELSGIHAEWRNDKPNSISPEKAAELFH